MVEVVAHGPIELELPNSRLPGGRVQDRVAQPPWGQGITRVTAGAGVDDEQRPLSMDGGDVGVSHDEDVGVHLRKVPLLSGKGVGDVVGRGVQPAGVGHEDPLARDGHGEGCRQALQVTQVLRADGAGGPEALSLGAEQDAIVVPLDGHGPGLLQHLRHLVGQAELGDDVARTEEEVHRPHLVEGLLQAGGVAMDV